MTADTGDRKTGRKRGNNEGTIKLRSDGRYEARVTFPDGRRKSYYGKTRDEVSQKLTRELSNIQQGLPATDGRVTLKAFLTDWLETSARPTVAPATHDSYRRVIESYILPELGRVRLDKLTPQRLQQLQAGMLARKLSPRTVAYTRAILRRALGQAVKWNLVPRNVATLVDPPKQERHEPEYLTPVQAKALMTSIAGDRLEPLILLTMVTGLRRGEVLSLRWRDVDLDAGTVKIEGQYQRWDGTWRWLPLKTHASRRTLAIPPFVVTVLRQHRTRQLEERLTVGSEWQDFGLVFATETGTPIDGSNLWRQWQRRLRHAELEPIPFHGLRHSAATLLLARGMQLGQIQKTLGHTNIKLTADLYAHFAQEIAERAANEMQAAFGSG